MSRMRFVATSALVLAATPAAANPCEVSIVRAPAGVAETIQGWVAREASCTTKLEVRVVATVEGGLYIIARDDRGRLHERVVPTAENAGVLIASWVADDSVGTPPVAPGAPDAVVDPFDDMRGSATDDTAGGPGTYTPTEQLTVRSDEHEPAVAQPAPRFLTIGALVGMSDGGGFGIRGEWDFSRSDSGRWLMGAMTSASTSTLSFMSATIETFDVQAGVYWQRVGDFGKWQIRGGAGAGLVYTAARNFGTAGDRATTVSPMAELDLRVSRQVARDWSIGFEPVAKFYVQSFTTERYYGVDVPAQTDTEARAPELAAVISVHHRM